MFKSTKNLNFSASPNSGVQRWWPSGSPKKKTQWPCEQTKKDDQHRIPIPASGISADPKQADPHHEKQSGDCDELSGIHGLLPVVGLV
jgi:hypothetical protein